MTFPSASTALDDLVVLDLTRVRAGPSCVRQLADWGARVIKIEQPDDGGDFGARHDSDFQNLHRNKRGMTLNLKTPEALAVFRRLVETADVVVENYRPDVKTRLGVDYDALSKINRRIVYASISGFGQDGPYRDRPGVDQIAQGMSGLMSVTGEPGRGPMRVGTAIGDVSAGILAATGVLIALHERQRSGLGQWVQTSLLEALIFMLDFQAARYTMLGEVAGQAGNNHPTAVPTGTFKTGDGYVNIAPTPPMWKRFCSALGRDAWIDDPGFATQKARVENLARLNAAIEDITVTMTNAELTESMNAAGIPCGPIYTLDQTFDDPQVRHLGIAQKVPSPALGEIGLVGQPFGLSRTPSTLVRGAPEHGEHTDEILRELGYGDAEIASLRARGAV